MSGVELTRVRTAGRHGVWYRAALRRAVIVGTMPAARQARPRQHRLDRGGTQGGSDAASPGRVARSTGVIEFEIDIRPGGTGS